MNFLDLNKILEKITELNNKINTLEKEMIIIKKDQEIHNNRIESLDKKLVIIIILILILLGLISPEYLPKLIPLVKTLFF